MSGSAWKKVGEYATGIVGLAMVAHLVLPRNNTASIIEEIGRSTKMMVQVAIGERIIETRDEPAFENLIKTVDEPTITELFAGLSDADLHWVETMLTLGKDPG